MLFGQIGLKTEFSVGVSIYIRPKFRHFRPKLVLLRRWIWMKADPDNPELDPRFSQLWIEITWINQPATGVIKLNGCVNVGCLQLCLLPFFYQSRIEFTTKIEQVLFGKTLQENKRSCRTIPCFYLWLFNQLWSFLIFERSRLLLSLFLFLSFPPLSFSLPLSFLPLFLLWGGRIF